MHVLRIEGLPAEPLAAATEFHAGWVERARAIEGGLALVFPPADHTHHAWRLAVVQALARERVPARVNALASDDEVGIAAALRYLEAAPGVTGQLLALDGRGAGSVVEARP